MLPDIGISNGIMSVILNYFKAMPDDIKFDILYFAEKEKPDRRILRRWGRVFKVDPPSPTDFFSGKMNSFLRHTAASGLHCIYIVRILLCLSHRMQKNTA